MRRTLILLFVVALALPLFAQAPAVVPATDLKTIVPTTYFYRGLSATVQARNAGAVKYSDGMYLIAALVDTSGYSTGVAQEYQGLLITEKKLTLGGQTLPPGQYGFGLNKEGKFHILDVSAHELAAADVVTDEKLAHPQPLKVVIEGGDVRLYLGRKYVVLKTE